MEERRKSDDGISSHKRKKEKRARVERKQIEISLSSRLMTFFKKSSKAFTTRVEVELCLCTSSSSFFFFFFEQREEERSFLCETTTTLSLYISLFFTHTHS
jgi:hypothetical protein